ncbi:MAG: sigma-70 family RNA polymerase sigma factor [Hyphomicrobiales bacterium]|uniref:sigma-70 family RNA polymerase sigma factor n=1 Tax=Rhabdaerophilum calidifontis TaxID=2604328 RepID=UPI00123AC40F|nr:sigma-70 family RNA polymerase sigma factor [Rhabdaerophilum calidifontis]MCA1951428.1 sigma-70 family RNA polymerase sigma factor [Hyphomicrobiales bacterium]MCA1998193.1 sigma-70 family RNA polymerase sigma factor [Hyphomicrobiales bacterium]
MDQRASPLPDLAGLLGEIAAGRQEAFRRLYEIEAARLLGIAMRILRRRALAEEAVHDALISVWNHAARYEARLGSPRAWLHTIVRNRALNILRGEARTELTAEIESFDAASEDENPEEISSRLSDADALKHCLERLDPTPRHAVILAYTQGLSHGEIAARLGVPLGTIKSRIRRSLIALKECLG